jgi:hypothetical protein
MTQQPTPAEVSDLAGDLIRELASLHGDRSAIDETCERWLRVVGPRRFGPVCAVALRVVFADCLTEAATRSDVPPGSVEFSSNPMPHTQIRTIE